MVVGSGRQIKSRGDAGSRPAFATKLEQETMILIGAVSRLAMLVNSQVVCLQQVGIFLPPIMFI